MTRKYRPLRLIGKGGMGDVYEGRMEFELDRERPCAIKLVREELSRDPDMLAMFGQEAMTAFDLNCPYLVRAYDFGSSNDGRLFLVLELIHGPDLAAASGMIDGNPRILRRIARDVLRGLAYLHERDIIHRDVSPANIMIDRSGLAKLSDLGIIRRVGGPDPQGLCGPPPYLAPEILHGGRASVASDAYAIGATLFELITGHPPRGREPDPDSDPADPPTLPDSVPADLAELVRDLLGRIPSERLTVAAALAQLDSDPDLLADDAELTELANTWLDANADKRAAEPEVTPLSLHGAALQFVAQHATKQADAPAAKQADAPATKQADAPALDPSSENGPSPSPPRERRRWFALGVAATLAGAALIATIPAWWPWQTANTTPVADAPADEQPPERSDPPEPAEAPEPSEICELVPPPAPPAPPAPPEPAPTTTDHVSPQPVSPRRTKRARRTRRTEPTARHEPRPLVRRLKAPEYKPVTLD